MAEASAEYNAAVHKLQVAMQVLRRVSSRVRAPPSERSRTETDPCLEGLEGRAESFVARKPPLRVLQGIGQFYMDMALALNWLLESKATAVVSSATKIQEVQGIFVSFCGGLQPAPVTNLQEATERLFLQLIFPSG